MPLCAVPEALMMNAFNPTQALIGFNRTAAVALRTQRDRMAGQEPALPVREPATWKT